MKARRPRPRTDQDRQKRRDQEAKAALVLRHDVPRVVIDGLIDARPSLANEPPSIQQGMAYLCWIAHQRFRRHSTHPGYFSVTYLSLKARFGRDKFERVNKKHNVFEILKDWGNDRTNAYRPYGDVEAAIDRRMALLVESRALTSLGRPDGSTVRSLRKPSALKNRGGLRDTFIKLEHLQQRTPVDQEALLRLEHYLVRARDSNDRQRVELLRAVGLDNSFNLEETLAVLRRIRVAARTDVVGAGIVLNDYEVKSTGRLFATGINLQSCHRLIKRAALNGLYEYDFSNCHLTIFAQLAERLGLECATVRQYLDNKVAIRQSIADRVGLSVNRVKACILMAAYGAPASVRPEDAIPSEIGQEAARRLYLDPVFAALNRELKGKGAKIIRAQPVFRRAITNAVGLRCRKSKSNPEKLAHILQGVEAQALYAIIREHGDDLLLYEHDGFVSRRRLDARSLQELVHRTTGFQLPLEMDQIKAPV